MAFGYVTTLGCMTGPESHEPTKADSNETLPDPVVPWTNPDEEQPIRPTTVTLAGWIAIICGALGIFIWGAALLDALAASESGAPIGTESWQSSLSVSRLARFWVFLAGTFIQVCVLAAGIQFFKRKGYKLFVFAALGKLLYDTLPIALLSASASAQAPDSTVGSNALILLATGWILLCLSLVWITRPNAKRWFSKQELKAEQEDDNPNSPNGDDAD